MKKDFENQNFEMFEEVVHNVNKSDGHKMFSEKCLFPLNAYMFSCPTQSKNLERTLLLRAAIVKLLLPFDGFSGQHSKTRNHCCGAS